MEDIYRDILELFRKRLKSLDEISKKISLWMFPAHKFLYFLFFKLIKIVILCLFKRHYDLKDHCNFVGETYDGEIYSSQPNTEKHILAAFGVKANIRAHFIDPVFTRNHRNTKNTSSP